jgi:hypothetical protein
MPVNFDGKMRATSDLLSDFREPVNGILVISNALSGNN